MAKISYPIEAFDEDSMKIDKLRPRVSFSFRQDLRDLCKDLEIPTTFTLEIDEASLNARALKRFNEADQRFRAIRKELSIKYMLDDSSRTIGSDILRKASMRMKISSWML